MSKSNKTLKTPLRVALACLIIGVLARIVHWPYAGGIILVSFLAIAILYAIRFSRKDPKKPVDYIKMLLVLFWTTNGLLRILDFPYTVIFQIGTALSFILWFAMEGTAYFMDQDRKSHNTVLEIAWNFAMVIGVLTIIAGGLMQLLKWEYAIPTLTTGLTIVTAYILKDIFNAEKKEKKDNNNEEFQL
ncbi:hypothetical protein [Maribacter cobaltidurans]|uniref:Uncharacterized protein n=1 Tax=Maribacter cobaltidurans TaxID=1178778 RepID=A0A223VBU8_9FLAO|nr:hypothetical protein [Maribacter cobaltidurans]ASV32468.1 hypothetical protein CJ263_20760 [Maribacter cobaltidurans]GGD75284.1 hypothetical protein GCM10011412_11250 [Maribacter cobaltidurans]